MRGYIMKYLTPYLLSLLSLWSFSLQAAHHGEQKEALWTLSPNDSSIVYGSIKKDVVGETNHFKHFSGHIDNDGQVMVNIDLSSVDTAIDIRNQRMIKYVFGEKNTQATLSTSLDNDMLTSLKIGTLSTIDIEGILHYSDKKIPIDTTMIVIRLSDERIMAITDGMIMIKADTLDINTGIDKLMELAGLPGITRVSPVTLRLVFDKNGKASKKTTDIKSPTKTNNVLAAGDVKKGKKLFRQCQACHNTKSLDHSVGPHLVNVIGRKAGSIDGFNFSTALAESSILWTEDTLMAFLVDPQKSVPGNRMPFGGIKKADDVKNITAYLKTL